MMKVETERDIAVADALLPLVRALAAKDHAEVRVQLANALDLTNPGWRDKPDFAARIREIGVSAAAEGLLKTHGLVTE